MASSCVLVFKTFLDVSNVLYLELFMFTYKPLSSTDLLLCKRYQFLAVLGQGGSAVVIKARDTFRHGNATVAIKILNRGFFDLGYQVWHLYIYECLYACGFELSTLYIFSV